jgi:MFS family permease
MYTTVRDVPGAQVAAPGSRRSRTVRVGGTVVALGAVSLLTDVSSEMVSGVLPVYLTLTLGLTPLAFGVLDGLYQGVSVLVRLGAGFAADRSNRPKATAVVGYALSAVCKVGLLLATGATAIGAVLAVDRTGKGLRTAPRDALIAAAAPPELLGRAFGVHRAMDTVGALLGPLLAFGLLLYLPGDYDAVFLVSLVVAVLGVGVLVTFVRERPPRGDQPVLRWTALRGLAADRRLRRITATSLVLGVLTVSDGFLYLLLRDRDAVDTRFFPLLYVGTALVYLVLAVPLGRLADRVGRVPVLVGGYVALLGCYAALLLGSGLGEGLTVLVLAGLGTYYAATDGILPALAAGVTPDRLRTSGIALVQTAVAGGRLLSAVVFGLLWTTWDQRAALVVFTLGLAVAVPVTAALLRHAQRPAEVAGG